ncbi:MAG: phosphotransferase [Planctomycetaceae bacterium]|nr:phosphotransferase [Planctomycetaceae bacterium]
MNLDIRPILAHYPADCQPTAIEYLGGAGGFSGSQFWRLTTPRGPLALRRYAPGLSNINDFRINSELWKRLRGVRLPFRVPIPINTTEGHQIHLSDNCDYWDLCDWLPGQIVPEGRVREPHVQSAMRALAVLHLTLQTLNVTPISPGRLPPAAVKRLDRIKELQQRRLPQIVDYVTSHPRTTPFWCDTAHTLAMWFKLEAPRLTATLSAAANGVESYLCVGDIWRDNVLFDPLGNVMSVIDIMPHSEPDSVATDVARLLGSLIAGHPAWWSEGLAAYESLRPLTAAERELAIQLDRANVLLSAWNWLEWLFVERRVFQDLGRVEERVRHFLTRLPEVFTPKLPS